MKIKYKFANIGTERTDTPDFQEEEVYQTGGVK